MSVFKSILTRLLDAASTRIGVASASAAVGTFSAAPLAQVDLGSTFDALNAARPEKLDWKISIADLMTIAGVDSGLSSRIRLARELGYSGDVSDISELDCWLHRAVIRKFTQYGGALPEECLRAMAQTTPLPEDLPASRAQMAVGVIQSDVDFRVHEAGV